MAGELHPLVGTTIGRYRVTRLLGAGGFGAVFQGVNPQIEKLVAIKTLHRRLAADPHLVQRFIDEARAVNIVQDPGIVSIFDFGQTPDGTPYIVMEYLAGSTLKQRMARAPALTLGEVLRLTRQIASTLAAAHGKGVVHRDLKPDNVMIVSDREAVAGERVKILDFGIAKMTLARQDRARRRTIPGMMIGTVDYMAPEQCRGDPDVGDRADVYSLGVLLYQLLSGRLPFDAEGPNGVVVKQLMEVPQLILGLNPTIQDELAFLLHEMLHKRPDVRPPMQAVADRLQAIAEAHQVRVGERADGSAPAQVASLSLEGALSLAKRFWKRHPSLPGYAMIAAFFLFMSLMSLMPRCT